MSIERILHPVLIPVQITVYKYVRFVRQGPLDDDLTIHSQYPPNGRDELDDWPYDRGDEITYTRSIVLKSRSGPGFMSYIERPEYTSILESSMRRANQGTAVAAFSIPADSRVLLALDTAHRLVLCSSHIVLRRVL